MKIYFGDIIECFVVVLVTCSACLGIRGMCCAIFRLVWTIFGAKSDRANVDRRLRCTGASGSFGTGSGRYLHVRRTCGVVAVRMATKCERISENLRNKTIMDRKIEIKSNKNAKIHAWRRSMRIIGIDKELIHFLERQIPQSYHKQLYYGGAAIL